MIEKLPLSVVIPTLNAERTLEGTLDALGPVHEIVVADADSTDSTAPVAARYSARVLQAPRGRGSQIAAGIAAARQDWLLVLHADTRLQPGWRPAAADHMRTYLNQAAYFRFALDSNDPRARRLERMVAWRCRVLALPYGDQGLLIHRDLLTQAGGMRVLPLMEDVDLIRRLGRRNLRALDATALTSAEKWQRDGWYRRSARNLCCLTLWFAGVPPRTIARIYG
jgi:rSAM/selenodomain-associated transferase 2